MDNSLLARLKRFDDHREGLPGEHWFALAAAFWLFSRHSPTLLGRLSTTVLGAALLCRAASGRDGARRLLPSGLAACFGGASRSRRIDPEDWPERRRVRVTAISQPIRRKPWEP